jgi:dipeptidyl aminopeptidase/acylaminoacyl peptidase
MNADGTNPVSLTTDSADDTGPAWSPDGTMIAFTTDRDVDREIYLMNADGSNEHNITNDSSLDFEPAWSPDGTRIAFRSNRDGTFDVHVMNADGSGETNLTEAPDNDAHPSWSPDGTRIVFYAARDGNNEIYLMNPDGSGQTRVTTEAASDLDPDWQTVSAKTVTLKAKPKRVEQGEKTRLKAKVSPCEGHEGDVVEFYRKKKRIASKKSNASCVATLKVKVKRTTKFRAVSPEQDVDHLAGTSKPVKVKVIG